MPRLALSGFDRTDEAAARAAFESLHLPDWRLGAEADADAVLIDLDSMYGQMAWMKGLAPGQVSIGLTRAARADTDHRLDAPLEASGLAAVLAKIAAGSPAGHPGPTAVPPGAVPEATPVAIVPPAPAHAATTTTREAPAAPPAPAAATRLAARLARASGALRVQVAGLPALVVDPAREQFAPGKSLKALLGYARAELPADAVASLDADEAAAALAAAGDPQPLARLAWLLALGAGDGHLEGHGAGTRFQLTRWPQVEREFPKHFRIATVMLKAPATVAEIALASGATEAEVADYVNAALAAGYAHVP